MKPASRIAGLAGLLALGLGSLASLHAQTFYVDFSTTAGTGGGGWTSVGSSASAYTISDIVDSTNAVTSVDLSINGGFGSTGGGVEPGAAAFTSTVSGVTHTFVNNAVKDYLAGTTSGVITFSGLDTTKTYTLEFFASRDAGASRITNFLVSNDGATSSSSVSLNAGDNISNTAFVSGFQPSATGEITITLTAAVGGNGYYYLNALALTGVASAIPEPSSFAALAGAAALGLVALRRRRR